MVVQPEELHHPSEISSTFTFHPGKATALEDKSQGPSFKDPSKQSLQGQRIGEHLDPPWVIAWADACVEAKAGCENAD